VTVETVVHRSQRTLGVRLREESLLQGLSDLRWQLVQLLRDGHGAVVIDIGGVDRLSSGTVAALLWVKRSCLARGVDMTVVNASGRNLEVMRRCGLLETLGAVPADGRR
jgi:anti-anti-sigma regulatory factor